MAIGLKISKLVPIDIPFNDSSRNNLSPEFNLTQIVLDGSITNDRTVAENSGLFKITQAASVCEPNFPSRNGVTCWDRKLLNG